MFMSHERDDRDALVTHEALRSSARTSSSIRLSRVASGLVREGATEAS